MTAHTEDDQAETLLMRLARGSGLDGLTGHGAQRVSSTARCVLLRPLLGVAGARLRATLRRGEGRRGSTIRATTPIRFERVRLRKARDNLAGLGLTNDKIALSARRLARAQGGARCRRATLCSAKPRLDLHAGAFASFDLRARGCAAPEELRLRLLARLIASFGGQSEPLRLAPLEALVDRLAARSSRAPRWAAPSSAATASIVRVLREPGRAPLPAVLAARRARPFGMDAFVVAPRPGGGSRRGACARAREGFAELRQQLDEAARIAGARRRHAAGVLARRRVNHRSHFAPLNGVSPAWGTAARLYSAEFLG